MAYAKGKRAEGKCGYSGCHEPSPDAFYCPDCKERVKQTREARYARLGGGKAA